MKYKNYKLFYFIALLAFAGCSEDEFYNDAGNKEVTNISSTPAADAELWYDLADGVSATIVVDHGSKGTIGSVVIRKRINDGDWVDHGPLGTLPATLQYSLDDLLNGTGKALADISTSDVIEIAYLIDGAFFNGHTTLPIVCSTDMTVANQSSKFFAPADGENAIVTFDMDVDGPARDNITSIDIFSSYKDGDPVKVTTLTTWPAEITLKISELAAAHGITDFAEVEIGDLFQVTYILNSSVMCKSENIMDLPYQCPSDLAGTYAYTAPVNWCAGAEVSGDVTWTQVSAGVYTLDDFSVGGYTSCYGAPATDWGTLTLVDVCNKLSFEGEDSYGDTWTISVDNVSGREMTISWTNTYGESGTATLINSDKDWPDLF